MKALVTGGHSFVGSTLIEELDTLGFEVFALLEKNSDVKNLQGLKYQRVDGDLRDFRSLCRAVEGVSYVFHLEEAISVPRRALFFDLNTMGTERLARAVAKVNSNLTRFVFLSSLAAAGPASSLEPKVESEEAMPVSAYGKSKLAGEKKLLGFKEDFPVSIVRPPMIYGPKDRNVLILIQTLAKNLMPILLGSTQGGHKYYSAIHVRDLCRGLVQVAVTTQDRVPSGELFYLSGDGIHTYQDLMVMIVDRLNCDPLKIKIPKVALQAAASCITLVNLIARKNLALNLDKLDEILSDYWICSNQKAKNMLSFSPEFDLASGIAHAFEWYKKQGWI